MQAGDDLLVGALGEVVVPPANRPEQPGGGKCDQFIGGVVQAAGPVEGCHRDGKNNPSRPLSSSNLAGSPGGGAGRDAVVDDHHGPPDQRKAGSITPEPLGTPFELGPLPAFHIGQLVVGDTGTTYRRRHEDAHATFADGAHGQLGLQWHPELTHHDHVQRSAERQRDLCRNRDPTARQSQDYHVLPPQMLQTLAQPPPSVSTIDEHATSSADDSDDSDYPGLIRRNAHRTGSAGPEHATEGGGGYWDGPATTVKSVESSLAPHVVDTW